MRTELFDYELPEPRIAQRPLARRDASRLLVVGPSGVEHRRIVEWPELVRPGSLVVLNDSRVMKARLVGRRSPTGGRAELLLLRRAGTPASSGGERFTALGRPARSLRPGTVVEVGGITATVCERGEGGLLIVELTADGGVPAALERYGRVPLPPYVRRDDDAEDVERYQTIYAERPGSAAAPTAGLHLTEELVARLRVRDVEIGAVTLHVGLGTFRPVTVDDLDGHDMHAELYEVGEDLARRVAAARDRGGAVVAVGTTVVRALESARDPERPELVRPVRGETRLLIQPGYRFGPVDALLTNFHQPRSTLLALVAAFAGRDRVMAGYEAALAAGYRFLSYGDAMWIPERSA